MHGVDKKVSRMAGWLFHSVGTQFMVRRPEAGPCMPRADIVVLSEGRTICDLCSSYILRLILRMDLLISLSDIYLPECDKVRVIALLNVCYVL